jgi:uncharacterized protein (TIGR00251 family)
MGPLPNGRPPYTIRSGRVVLKVKAFPKSARNAVMGVRNGELVVRLQAPALDGRANRELLKFLAKTLAVARSDIDILSGETSRHKVLALPRSAEPSLESIL